MTYEDFISEVKKYLNSSQVAFSKTGPNNINSDFSANDIEVGKIYMTWPNQVDMMYIVGYRNSTKETGWGKGMVWFVAPYERIEGEKVKLYYCSGFNRDLKKEVIKLQQNTIADIWWDEQNWKDFAWAGNDWVEILTPQKFINWNEFPWGDVK